MGMDCTLSIPYPFLVIKLIKWDCFNYLILKVILNVLS